MDLTCVSGKQQTYFQILPLPLIQIMSAANYLKFCGASDILTFIFQISKLFCRDCDAYFLKMFTVLG